VFPDCWQRDNSQIFLSEKKRLRNNKKTGWFFDSMRVAKFGGGKVGGL